ncbi:MAG: DUF4337 domain-containing protein [Acidobacteriota bacterium]|nr:DUF4337 domain-containing protein [Acidobacteriota bacterium]
MEATEMQEFSKQMKEGGEESLTSISLAISVLAVLVATVTVLGHRSHTKAVLEQALAADEWNYYQAKHIREENMALVVDELQLEPTVNPQATAAKIAEYKVQIAKWLPELTEQQNKARELERGVAHAESQAARYDLGEALLQISVVLSSITLFTRKRTWFFGGVALGAAGLLIAASALLVH